MQLLHGAASPRGKVGGRMFYVRGESIDGEYYEFIPAGRTLNEIKDECQELLETLDGGFFGIYNITDDSDSLVDYVDW